MPGIRIPDTVGNWIDNKTTPAVATLTKTSPHDGRRLWDFARSGDEEVNDAVAAARAAQPDWAGIPPVERGKLLLSVARAIQDNSERVAEVVASETGKSMKEALGETGGAVQCAEFFAGEGMRLEGRTFPSGVPGKSTMTVRQPRGVAGLIVAANTPAANVAWKVFPALICGNSAVMKAAEDTPATAWLIAKLAAEAGLPAGVFNVVQGLGAECGMPLVEHPNVPVISFTGSTAVGRTIAEVTGRQLKRVSLELGGKNPLLVCDDADIDHAVHWTVMSSFSNAGQRCAASSRIVVDEAIYDEFRSRLLSAIDEVTVGPDDADLLGPVINERQLEKMLMAIISAETRGATISAGGRRLEGPRHRAGHYLAPTVLENVPADHPLGDLELFGPICVLYRVAGFRAGLELAQRTAYGLAASIHTRDLNRALVFTRSIRAGTVNVNLGTHGSEPHFPFGGYGMSGNGSREPGREALDVYSELQTVSFFADGTKV